MPEQTAFLFGKYAGKAVDDVPIDYLRWALEKMEKLMPETEAMIRKSLARRGEVPPPTRLDAVLIRSGLAEPQPERPIARSHTQFPCPACGKALRIALDDSAR